MAKTPSLNASMRLVPSVNATSQALNPTERGYVQAFGYLSFLQVIKAGSDGRIREAECHSQRSMPIHCSATIGPG